MSWNKALRPGINAIKSRTQSIFFSQWRRFSCIQPMTPVMLNMGSHAPRDAHLDSESGVKFGRAGRSGGKKRHCKM